MNTAFANVKTITKRELTAYFASPVAYVFIVIFLLLAGFSPLWLGSFSSGTRRTSNRFSSGIHGFIFFLCRRWG